jgi:hypothetical protein
MEPGHDKVGPTDIMSLIFAGVQPRRAMFRNACRNGTLLCDKLPATGRHFRIGYSFE